MNTEFDQFEALRRLLQLKRREVPPPGYFDQLAQTIQRRLACDPPAVVYPWWQAWLAKLEFRPAFAAGLAGVAAGVYLVGISWGGDAAVLSTGGLKVDPNGLEWSPNLTHIGVPVATDPGRVQPVRMVDWRASSGASTTAPPAGLFAPGGRSSDSPLPLIQRASWSTPTEP